MNNSNGPRKSGRRAPNSGNPEENGDDEECILIVAPLGQDATAVASLLGVEGFRTRTCEGLTECSQSIARGIGALILTEEALDAPRLPLLLVSLHAQPPWSELPLIILTSGGESRLNALLDNVAVAARAATVFLERPMSQVTLLRSVQVALNYRRRQYQVRDLLEKQHQSEERLRLIIGNAREYAIISMDLARRVQSWNPGAEAILGYSEAEILGEDGDRIFTPEDIAAGAQDEEAETALREGREADERWHVRKDGSRFWGSGVMMAMRDGVGRAIGFVKILRDSSVERQSKLALEESRQQLLAALEETERARAEAEAAGQAKDHFLAVLSHELRTPLTPVMMAANVLARRKDLPEPVREALEMIQRNIELEARFVDDLLDLTRINRGTLELYFERMDMHAAITNAVEITRADFAAKQQEVTLSLQASDHQLDGDLARLQQVIWNLLKNAAKFSPESGKIHVATRKEQGKLLIAVSDTGIGIEPAAMEHIFDAFTQADASIAQRFGGLGLGLAIAKATMVGHGGDLLVQSDGPGRGSTFTASLPIRGSN